MFAFRRLGLTFIALVVAGCSVINNPLTKYELKEPDPSKGIVVGTVYQRAAHYEHNLRFVMRGPKEELMAVTTYVGRSPSDFTDPKGMGHAFALQLTPGKYRVSRWTFPAGAGIRSSSKPEPEIEFEVQAGKVFYLGRFEANLGLEVAGIYDNLQGDLPRLRTIPGLNVDQIENRSLSKRGWWVNETEGKAKLQRMGNLRCELC